MYILQNQRPIAGLGPVSNRLMDVPTECLSHVPALPYAVTFAGVFTLRIALAAMLTVCLASQANIATTQHGIGENLNNTFYRTVRPSAQSMLQAVNSQDTRTKQNKFGVTPYPHPSTQSSALAGILQSNRSYASGKAQESREIQPRKSGARNVTETITEPTEEIHLHLGKEELVNCFMRTAISGTLRKPRIKATRVAREVNARKGSITGGYSFDADELRNISRKLQSKLVCKVHTGSHLDHYCCALNVSVPKGSHIAIVIPEQASSITQLYDEKQSQRFSWTFNATEDNTQTTVVFLGSSNAVTFLHIVTSLRGRVDSRFYLRFQTLDDPELQVIMTGFHTGVVQTPLHQDNTFLITPLLDHWAHVSVPSGHVIMVSYPLFEAMKQCVALYARDKGNTTLLNLCPELWVPTPPASIYNTTSLLVHSYPLPYYTNADQSGTGLQLYFSFLNESALPTQLPDKSWNCSGPGRHALIYHLSCNIEVDCLDAADEEGCPYTTDLCGTGYLTLGGACFFFIRKEGVEKRTAFLAEVTCNNRGGRLAVLNTADKWTEAVRVMPMSSRSILLGIRSAPSSLPLWYARTYTWVEGSTAFELNTPHGVNKNCERRCGAIQTVFRPRSVALYLNIGCNEGTVASILCEKRPPSQFSAKAIFVNITDPWPRDTAYVECPSGHYTHHFLACDVKSSCWYDDPSSYCGSSLSSRPLFFACSSGSGRVPYTLVCDHRADCLDSSDEDFCIFPACRTEFSCGDQQCIPWTKVNDGWQDCYDRADENELPRKFWTVLNPPSPALVTLSDKGLLIVTPLKSSEQAGDRNWSCPGTHLQCLNNGYCLPVFLRCNGVDDCPGHEDEQGCEMCPGLYRCRDSKVCLMYSQLCDGRAHCLQHDDELLCNSTCPPFCVCRGMSFFCRRTFPSSAYPFLRFLDASGSGITPVQLSVNTLLIHLILVNCGLVQLDDLSLPNLLILHIGDNGLTTLSDVHLAGVPQVRELSVAGNPMALVFEGDEKLTSFPSILKFDLSRAQIRDLNVSALRAFPNIQVLNLSQSGVRRVQGDGFSMLKQLQLIDLRGCPMIWFPRGLFQGLSSLKEVHAQSFKVYCSAVLPLHFNQRHCFAPKNLISSCDDLLRATIYKVCVFTLSLFALVGNGVSFVFRTYISKRETRLGYGHFVTHLSVSDFLMGVYLGIIGVADQVYHDSYLWNDFAWKHSVTCKLAGFLSLLSSEVSTLIVCLITVDRFLVLSFPFSNLHFSPKSAHIASAIVWISGAILVSVPLLPSTSHWEFYSQTGICTPLPTTITDFAGRDYSFAILIIFNFVIFLIISVGQLSIYWSVRANSMATSNTTMKTKDLSIARRLITVAMTDFLCWFPVCVLGLMASNGAPIPGEVNVVVVVFVLPLNSAVNPCLYTANVILERRRRARLENLRSVLLAQIQSKN